MRPATVLVRFLIVPILSATLAAAAGQQPSPSPAPQEKAAEKKDDAKKKPDLPLTAARTIEFDTDEGTWVSLDVTPDGQSIIFELSGDLYRLPMAGGAATRIMGGLAYDAQPRVSPDGTRIAVGSPGTELEFAL